MVGQGRAVKGSTMQCSEGQHSAVQYSAVQYRAAQCSAVQGRAGQNSTGQGRAGQNSTGQCSTGQHRTLHGRAGQDMRVCGTYDNRGEGREGERNVKYYHLQYFSTNTAVEQLLLIIINYSHCIN